MNKTLPSAIATLIGTVIGAGILGIPYVVSKAGFLTGIVDVILIGAALMLLNLYLGEVVLRTQGDHQLTGYARIYLGRLGKKFMAFSMIFGIYGALVAYLIGEGNVIYDIFGGNKLFYIFIFFVFVASIIYSGLKTMAKSELYLTSGLITTIIIISIFAFPYIKASNLPNFNISRILVPYGVVLFAYLGITAIPEVKEELKENKKLIKKAVVAGSLIPIIIYLLFTLAVVGVSGTKTTDIATIALGNILGWKMTLFANLFAMIAMATSFLALGIALKEMYIFDYNTEKHTAWLLTISIPLAIALIIYFFRVGNAFSTVLDITGTLAGGTGGILVVLMYWKAKRMGNRNPEYSMHRNKIMGVIFILLFILGIAYKALELAGFINV